MWSVRSRRSESSTAWRTQRRDSPVLMQAGVSGIGLPTLVAISTRARLPALPGAASQLPMTVSDSPPVWPGTQRE